MEDIKLYQNLKKNDYKKEVLNKIKIKDEIFNDERMHLNENGINKKKDDKIFIPESIKIPNIKSKKNLIIFNLLEFILIIVSIITYKLSLKQCSKGKNECVKNFTIFYIHYKLSLLILSSITLILSLILIYFKFAHKYHLLYLIPIYLYLIISTKGINFNNNNINKIKELENINIKDPKVSIIYKRIKKCKKKNINLQNPVYLYEKVNWLGCFDNIPLKSKLADKLRVCEYTKEKLGVDLCIPKLKIYNTTNEINFDELPESFMLKTNHGSGRMFYEIVRNKTLIDKEKIKIKFNKALKINFANINYESHYFDIKPKVYAEKLLSDENGDLKDYKFMCLNWKI